MQYKVSVVIPVYNVKQYLSECVDSVIKQTYKNIEIILVDDGSTDGSRELCDEFAKKDERIKVFHKENGGLSDARNFGMDKAEGTFIYFLDSDDLIEPYAIAVLTEIAVSNAADVVLFDARVIDENGVQQMDIPSYMWYYRIGDYSACYQGKELFSKLESNREYRSAVPLLFIKRDAIKYRFVPILHEDELFTIQLLYSVERAVFYPEVLYIRRVRTGSITTVRKTPRHYRGIQTVIFELARIPQFDAAIARYISRLYVRQQVTYHNLPRKEKKIISKEKKALDTFVLDNHYFKNKKLRRAFYKWHFPMYSLIGNKIELKIGKVIDKLRQRQNDKKQLKKIKNTNRDCRIFMIGTPRHGNLGDHAIAVAEEHFIKEILPDWEYLEIEMPFYRKCKKEISKLVRSKDLIIVSGGGWMGNQWFHNEMVVREVVQTYQKNPVLIFPQTIYYQVSENMEKEIEDARRIYSAHPNLLMCLRDEQSFLFAKKNGFGKCVYVPDIVLYEKMDSFALPRSGILVCKRFDREKSVSDEVWEKLEDFLKEKGGNIKYTTTIIGKFLPENRNSAIYKKLLEFARVKLIVTDRLHAMIFAAITGTPCVAFDNTSKKVSGVYKWIEGLPYVKCVEDTEQAKKEIVDLLKQCDEEQQYIKPDFTGLRDALVSMTQDIDLN